MHLSMIFRYSQPRIYLLAIFALLILVVPSIEAYSQEPLAIIEVALIGLPPEAATTLKLIKQGGPFPYPRDGVVFGNREKQLPKKQRGYYHEYTVKTPGARNRGARRIVCGKISECYYSGDHYQTFKLIRE